MEPNQEQQQSTMQEDQPLLSYFDLKKIYLILGVILFLIIISIISIVVNKKTDTTSSLTPTPRIQKPTSIPTPIDSTTTIKIKSDAKPQIDSRVNGLSYTVDKTATFGDNWAIIQISNPTTDTAWVIVKKENNIWNVMYGPGTSLPASDLKALGAPQELIDASNKKL